jgi:hypothetical protein
MPPKLARKNGKRNHTRLAVAIITERIGTTAHNMPMYPPTSPTSGRCPGM